MRVFCLILLLSALVSAKPVILDGREIDVPTTVQNGRTMMELRTLAEALGWNLEYRDGRAIVSTGRSNTEVQPKQSVMPPEAIPSEEILSPADDSVIHNLRPEISARFTTLLAKDQPFQLIVNGNDVTAEASLQANEIRWRAARQIGAGRHEVELRAVNQKGERLKRAWSFIIKNRLSD